MWCAGLAARVRSDRAFWFGGRVGFCESGAEGGALGALRWRGVRRAKGRRRRHEASANMSKIRRGAVRVPGGRKAGSTGVHAAQLVGKA